MSYSSTEWRTFEPLARQAEVVARTHPDRRDLFLCHAWDDRQGAAKDLCDLLVSHGATVWFSEYDVGLGKSLLTEIDKGLRSSRAGIVLVTPAMLQTLEAATGIASKELAALLATDRVVPVAHGVTFDDVREVSPLLGARSGLTTGEALSLDEAAKKIAGAAAAEGVV
ncbi:MAG: toll/interleukin-1 receptor domain-containing protein [Marmoricola sp.]